MQARPSGRARRLGRLRPFLVLFLLISISAGVIGPSAPSVAQTSPTDDPAGDYSMWRDDEVFVPLPSAIYNRLESYAYEYHPTDQWLPGLYYCGRTAADGSQMGAASGRIMSAFSDQVVVAFPGWMEGQASGDVEVRFADGCDPATRLVDGGPPAWVGLSSALPALADPVAGHPSWFDITTGDLDRRQSSAEGVGPGLALRDEVVVAYASPYAATPGTFRLVVAVLDYTDASRTDPSVNPSASVIIPAAIPSDIALTGLDVASIPLSVTTGDFDGDTHKEIAVAYLNGLTTIGVSVLRYSTVETEGGAVTHSLSLAHTVTSTADTLPGYMWGASRWVGPLDAATGDFNGDGKDELSVGATAHGKMALLQTATGLNLKTFRFDADLAITQVDPNSIGTVAALDLGTFGMNVQLASGLYKFAPSPDPLTNYGPNRRQLAVAFNDGTGAAIVGTAFYDGNLVPTFGTAQTIPAAGRLNFWMAAGGFNGLRSGVTAADVVWTLAISTWADNGQMIYLFDPDPVSGNLSSPAYSKLLTFTANPSKSTSVAPVVAYDHGRLKTMPEGESAFRGDSVYLSPPVHIILDGYINADYILQEPPKHVYWDPTGGIDGRGAVVNVSAQDTFKLGRKEETTVGVTKSVHDIYDHSWGVSETVSATLSYGGGLWVPPKFEASLKETVGYDYDDHQDDYNKNTSQRTVSLSLAAVRDDAISYRVQTIDVWRYYVFGAEFQDLDGNPLLGFFDITAPRPAEDDLVPGAAYTDWYQPVHENNNILSYPAPTDGTFTPSDMGSFQVPCTDISGETCDKDPDTGKPLTTMTVTGPLLDRAAWVWGGISGEQELRDTRQSTTGTERKTSKTLTANTDLKMTVRGRIPFTALWKAEISADIAFHGKWSWGDANSTEATTTELTSIWLNVPPGNTSMAYKFYPLFYVTTDGTTKAAFAVDTTGTSGEAFWDDIYGNQPDPALNLPLRFNAKPLGSLDTTWEPNTASNRKLIRGFFVRHAEPDLTTGEYTEYSGPPSSGETVRLEARVYNYSTKEGVGTGYDTKPLTVRFEYVELDGTQELLPRTPIGTTTVQTIAPRGMETAAVNWTIPTFSDAFSKNYRIYVVLDPDNAIPNEKYETESAASRTYCYSNCGNPASYIDPGQNNEGYRQMTVLPAVATHPRYTTPGDVHLKSDALAAINPRGKLTTKNVQAYVGLPLQIRVRIDTDQPGADYQHLLVYDGDPNAGGTVIADIAAYTGNPDGNEVWIEWTPTELGPHRLYAKVVESGLDPTAGNATSDVLKVEVIKAPQGPKEK